MPPRRSREAVEDCDAEAEQRPRQRQRRGDPASEEEDSDEQADDDAQRDDSQHSQLVKKLVRYALACEYSRTPIRRDAIRENVLGNQGRSFQKVFDNAQKTLRAVYGMEMTELPVKDKLTKEEKRKAAKSQNKAAKSNAYMLVTMLPEKYRTASIIAPSIIQSADEEAAYVAFYTMVISMITLNSGELSEAKMKRYLRRLNAETNTFNAIKTEDTLAKLQRQGYLVKHVDKEAKQHGGDDATTWYVGPRGKIECNDEAIAGFIREVYGNSMDTDDLEKRLKASLQIQERKPAVQDDEDAEENGEAAGGRANSVRQNGARQNSESSGRRSARHSNAQEDEEEEEDNDEKE